MTVGADLDRRAAEIIQSRNPPSLAASAIDLQAIFPPGEWTVYLWRDVQSCKVKCVEGHGLPAPEGIERLLLSIPTPEE